MKSIVIALLIALLAIIFLLLIIIIDKQDEILENQRYLIEMIEVIYDGIS